MLQKKKVYPRSLKDEVHGPLLPPVLPTTGCVYVM